MKGRKAVPVNNTCTIREKRRIPNAKRDTPAVVGESIMEELVRPPANDDDDTS